MTLARTALRLCVSACLKGTAGARPTIAEGRIYDSRISELAPETLVDDALATVILLSDTDEGPALSQQNGGPPFIRSIDLVFETGMVEAIKEGDDYLVGYPDTDARLEASLDLLQHQIIRRLADGLDPVCIVFRRFVRIRRQESHRQVLDESGVKLACRILTLTCEVNDDQSQFHNASSDAPSGLDRLPQPLRQVAEVLPAGSAGRAICEALAKSIAVNAVPDFTGADFQYDADARSAPLVEQTIEFPQP